MQILSQKSSKLNFPDKYYAPLLGLSSIIAGFLSSFILLFGYSEHYVIEWSPLLNFMGIITTLTFFFNYRAYRNIENFEALYRGLVTVNIIVCCTVGILGAIFLPPDLLTVVTCFLLAGTTLPLSKYYIPAGDFRFFAIVSSIIVLARPIVLFVLDEASHGLLIALVVSQTGNTLLFIARARKLKVKIFENWSHNSEYSNTTSDFSEFFCRAAFALLFFAILSFHPDVSNSVDYLLILFSGILFALSNSIASYLESKVERQCVPRVGVIVLETQNRIAILCVVSFCIVAISYLIVYLHPLLSYTAEIITGYKISVAACFVGAGLVATETLRLLCVRLASSSLGLFSTQARYGVVISGFCAALWWLGFDPLQLLAALEVVFICLYASVLIRSIWRK